MDAGTVTMVVQDYGGLVIGLVLLLLAVSILPGRAKWYMLTAGLAVLGYEAYMRTVNRKLLKEADNDRERLRGEMKLLDDRRLELEESVTGLNRQLAELNSRIAGVNSRKTALEQEGGDIAAGKEALDKETNKLIDESRELVRQSVDSAALLKKIQEANQAVDQMGRTTE